MKVLMIGDVVGEAGRKALARHLPDLNERHAIDYIVVNAENLAGGFGITEPTCKEIFGLGVHVLTSGNHIWDKREVLEYIPGEPRLLRPYNYPADCPGSGVHLGAAADGTRVAVLNLQGRVFMPPIDCPFRGAERALAEIGDRADVVLVDIHAEATSEKMAMGHFLDGRVSMVVGTHTHVPTADAMILTKGTAYQTDAGMCGDYDSVIGMGKLEPLKRFVTGMSTSRFEPALGEATICGTYAETDDKTGLARRIVPIRLDGKLESSGVSL